MSNLAKTVLFAALALTSLVGESQARERAPVEFANRSARAVEAPRVQLASATSTRRASDAAMDMPEMLYGYGGRSSVSTKAPLDLRGTLRAGAPSDLLADDAFDDAPPAQEPPTARAEAAEAVVVTATATTPPTDQPVAAPVRGGYFVQVGAFADPSNAERVRTALLDVGQVAVDVREGPSVTLHRVRLGQWASRAEAELARDVVVERGFAGAVVAAAR